MGNRPDCVTYMFQLFHFLLNVCCISFCYMNNGHVARYMYQSLNWSMNSSFWSTPFIIWIAATFELICILVIRLKSTAFHCGTVKSSMQIRTFRSSYYNVLWSYNWYQQFFFFYKRVIDLHRTFICSTVKWINQSKLSNVSCENFIMWSCASKPEKFSTFLWWGMNYSANEINRNGAN